jgi:IS5 family transposase
MKQNKKPNRDEKARTELREKVEKEAKAKINEAVAIIEKNAVKITKQNKPYLALECLQRILTALESKTVIMHQPHIVPMTEDEIKEVQERKEQEQKMFDDMKKERDRRAKMPENQKPKTISP